MCVGVFYVISMIIFDGLLIALSKTGSLSQQLAYLSLGFNFLDGECDVFKVVIDTKNPKWMLWVFCDGLIDNGCIDLFAFGGSGGF